MIIQLAFNNFKNVNQSKVLLYKFSLSKSLYKINKNLDTFFFLKNHTIQNFNSESINISHNSLRRYPLFLKHFKKNLHKFHGTNKVLNLNFPRNRFFPNFKTLKGETYMFLSLGMFSKFFIKNKSFMKTKQMYLVLASFLRKVLLFSSIKFLYLLITNIPVYLKEIMSTLNNSVINYYKNPFNENVIINEKEIINPFKFSFFMFFKNKPYGKVKIKKRGRLKRKITKRLIQTNRVLD